MAKLADSSMYNVHWLGILSRKIVHTADVICHEVINSFTEFLKTSKAYSFKDPSVVKIKSCSTLRTISGTWAIAIVICGV